MPLFNFFLIIGVFFIGLVWYLHGLVGSNYEIPAMCKDVSEAYKVKTGDTCWDIAQSRGLDLSELLKENDGLDCNKLVVGSTICILKS